MLIPCSRGEKSSVTLPHWLITFANGTRVEETPPVIGIPNHVQAKNGLNVTVSDPMLNLTTYICFYETLVPGSNNNIVPERVLSNTGVLTISSLNVTFSLELRQYNKLNQAFSRTGGEVNFAVVKQGEGNFTFNISTITTSGKVSF